MTVRDLLDAGTRLLLPSLPPEQARIEAETLLSRTLARPRAWLFAHPEAPVASGDGERALSALARRATGEPTEYITGQGEFYGLDLALGPDVLVPRPETEVLVEAALAALAGHEWPLVADVGTGSGAIALAIAANHAGARVCAGDTSLPALAIARRNVVALGLAARVHLFAGDLLAAITARFDLIAANLPYVADSDLAGPAAAVVRFEPRRALAGGDDGLAIIAGLLKQAPAHLAPGGTLLAEIGSLQGPETARLATRCVPSAAVDVLPDLSGTSRVLRLRMPR